MNNVVLMGRLTKDPVITRNQEGKAIARFSLAIDRIGDGTDYPSCVAFDKTAEVIEKYVQKGTKIVVSGRIQTGSYKNRDDKTVYTTDVVVNNMEFCESKKQEEDVHTNKEGFIEIDESEEGLPF